jgi:hypothetical protein
MTMTVEELERIAVEVARDEATGYEVAGVTRGATGSDYAEVLMHVRTGDGLPSSMVIGTFRNSTESVVRSQLTSDVRRYAQEREEMQRDAR